MRKLHVKLTLFVVAIALFSCKDEVKKEVKPELGLPNVVLIFTDDQGYIDVGVFGADDIATPNLGIHQCSYKKVKHLQKTYLF